MDNKIMKKRIITYTFIFLITITGLFMLIIPDKEVSFSERRSLYSWEDLKDSEDISSDFEKYALDHFFERDFFRKIKAFSEYNLFLQKDNNDLYSFDDYFIKKLYPLNDQSVRNFAKKINDINEMYLNDNDVFYSVIPDKNYFVPSEDYLKLDYEGMENLLQKNIDSRIKYIDIFEQLNLADFYKTDHHFKMNRLSNVIFALGDGMEADFGSVIEDYKLQSYYPFYGAYYGQSAMSTDADRLMYYESDILNDCTVTIWKGFNSYEEQKGVYDYEKLGSIDSYDFFLYGTKPVVTIDNPNAYNNRELVIFKDSFANSLTPLLVESYSRITLVDLRLVNHTALDNFVDFENAEVLFLYSTMIINNSAILK